MISKDELKQLFADTESYRVERTVSIDDADKFCMAICAFSNDISGSGKNGYLILGVHNNGKLSGLKVDDRLLLQISNIRTFDAMPCLRTAMGDLDVPLIKKDFLPQAIAEEVLAEDKRPIPVSVLREETVSKYPYRATRELLMNAVMHRDYETNSPVQFYKYDDRIEVQNPGGLYGKVTPNNLGLGIEDHQENTQKKPKKSPRSIQIVAIIRSNPQVTRRELAKLLNCTQDSIKYHLKQLTNEGVIKHEGSTKADKWNILKIF